MLDPRPQYRPDGIKRTYSSQRPPVLSRCYTTGGILWAGTYSYVFVYSWLLGSGEIDSSCSYIEYRPLPTLRQVSSNIALCGALDTVPSWHHDDECTKSTRLDQRWRTGLRSNVMDASTSRPCRATTLLQSPCLEHFHSPCGILILPYGVQFIPFGPCKA